MQNSLIKEKSVKVSSINGIDIFQIKTDKFKTNSINIFFHDSLDRESAAKNALIPAVLRRGCKRFPTFQDIAMHLEELYGSTFDCGVNKKGERQLVQFYIEFVSERFTGENMKLFEKAFDLLYDIIMSPVTENNVFKKEYVEQEKENLKRLIESRVNDKSQYSVDRCFEEMCKEEPFGVYEYGSVQDLDSINNENLFEYYKCFLETLPIQVYISGDIEYDEIFKITQKLSNIKRGQIKNVDISFINKEINEVKEVTEKMSISQGKLSLGFRTNTKPSDEDYNTLMVYNGILGGGIHSKLFQNVREKASLAYYAFSRLEKFKGLMVISSGIEIENQEKAKKIIFEQLEEIKSGNISDYEFESTIKTIETGINSLKDNQLQIVDFYLGQSVGNTRDDLNLIIEKVKKVTKKEVIEISKKIRLDTIYFLTAN